jgi:hypothetical protein
MIWTVVSWMTCFALGATVMRKFPNDESLNALCELTEAPFRLVKGFLDKTNKDEKGEAVVAPEKGSKKPTAA